MNEGDDNAIVASENNEEASAVVTPLHECGKVVVQRLSEGPPPRLETLLVLVTVCGVFGFAPLYGFNVYIVPLLEEFTDDTSMLLNMRDGSPVYVGGLAIFSLSAINFVVAPTVETWGFRRMFFMGIATIVSGLVLTFVAVRYKQLWLLYIGYGIVFGSGTGLTNLPCQSNIILWFRVRLGAPGLGSGLFGFVSGMWPALFSYFGPALERSVGISYSFLVLALIVAALGWWVGFFMYSPKSIEFNERTTCQRNTNVDVDAQSEGAERSANHDPPYARIDNALSAYQVLHSQQFWLTFGVFFLAVFPGFGVKLVVSPLLQGVFDASQSQQSAASTMFLISYAAARLCFGPVSDRYRAKPLLLACLLIQSVVCIFLGVVVWKEGGSNDKSSRGLWTFALVNMMLGVTMAGVKVIYGVFLLTIFGAPSLSVAIGRLFLSMGLSAFLAPICMWSVLVASGEDLNGDDPGGKTVKVFTHSVALFFWGSTFGSLAAAALLMFVQPFRFQSDPSEMNMNDDAERLPAAAASSAAASPVSPTAIIVARASTSSLAW